MPALALLAPLLASAANACYLVTNTRIEIIPCNFDPAVISARLAEIGESEPTGRQSATPAQGSTPSPRVQARERPQSGAARARADGNEPSPARDREAMTREPGPQEARAQPAASSGASPQQPVASQAPAAGAGPQQPAASQTSAPGGQPQPSAAPQPTSRSAEPEQAAASQSVRPGAEPQPSAAPQAVARGTEAQQALDATVAELRGLEAALTSGSPGDAGPVLARAAQAFAAANSPQGAASVATAQQALARRDLYAARLAVASAIEAATRR